MGNETNIFAHWVDFGQVVEPGDDGVWILKKEPDMSSGAEKGLVSKTSYGNMRLSFEVNLKNDACFIAKILQAGQFDQKTNSYHIMQHPQEGYFARHYHIFEKLRLPPNVWEKLELAHHDGEIALSRNDKLVLKLFDGKLRRGYAFLGLKAGAAHLKNISLAAAQAPVHSPSIHGSNTHEILHDFSTPLAPMVSIITTVYDRIECLKNCIKSVKGSTFHDYEHLIVSDAPPEEIVAKIMKIIETEDNGKIRYANLARRYNNWGIAPAAAGLRLAQGDYIGFLSDDNGYTPEHISTLVQALEKNPELGFAYSSCLYDGRGILNSSVPRLGRIDLGQPLFRREIFQRYLQNQLPFNILAWDWQMIEFFMRQGVRWKHINQPSFLFRLAKYPKFMSA